MVEYYQGIFQMHGSRGSALTVVPFNQGSKQDVDTLVNYIYSTLNLDLDYVLPFTAIPENGREIGTCAPRDACRLASLARCRKTEDQS